MTRTRTVPLLLAGVALAGGVTGAATVRALDDDDPPAAAASTLDDVLDPTPVAKADSDEPLAQAAAKILQSVVSITATDDRGTAEGSGVVLSEDGLVLTNNHVVASVGDGADLEVTLPDGSTESATVEGRDPASDLAVIRIEDASGLTPATLGSSGDLSVGETVLAVGSPLGLDGSVSAGIVSAVGRAITLGAGEPQSPEGGGSSGPAAVIDAIQTDAAINPGNSGGPLVNSDGDVVGINTAIASLAQGVDGQGGNIGVGFAIPIDEAKAIAEELAETGEATHAYMGVGLEETEDGIRLAEVVEDGPAADAGLKEGDLVTKIGDEAVRDVASLTAGIRAQDPGDKVKLTVVRDGKESTVEVELGTYPKTES